MIGCNELGFIKDKIFGLTGFDFVGEITVKSFDGVKVDFDGENAYLGYIYIGIQYMEGLHEGEQNIR